MTGEHVNPDLDRPVFIVGSASSGTTLLGITLDKHTKLACGPELYAFDKHRIYGRYGSFKAQIETWLQGRLIGNGQIDTGSFFCSRRAYSCDVADIAHFAWKSKNLREFFDRFFTHYLLRRGKQRWIEKTGSNAYELAQIVKLYPLARIVHIVRDGRDVVSSLLGRADSFYHCVSHWLWNVSASVAWEEDLRYLKIHYEDLVRFPEKIVMQICEHIGAPFEARMLHPDVGTYWREHGRENIHASWQVNPLSGTFSPTSIGRYKRDLTEPQLAAFWNTMLTPWARARLGVRIRGTRDLMHRLAYTDEGICTQSRVPLSYYRDGICCYNHRRKVHFAANRRFWLPITYANPSGLLRKIGY